MIFNSGRGVPFEGKPVVVDKIRRIAKERLMVVSFCGSDKFYDLPWDRRVDLVLKDDNTPIPPVAVINPIPVKCDDPSPIIAAESNTDSFVVGGAVGGCRKPSAQGCPCPCGAPAKKRERPAMPPNPGPPRQVGMTQVQRDDLLLAVLNAVNEFTEKMRSLVKKATGI